MLFRSAFQPAFVLETTLDFLEEGLTRSAYYHIRDAFVDEAQFAQFMSPKGAAFVARWWNDTPQYDGLFDNHGQVRPAYFAFKLMSLIKGRRLAIQGANEAVKGFAAANPSGVHAVIWNFGSAAGDPQEVVLRFRFHKAGQYRLTRLNCFNRVNQLELKRHGNFTDSTSASVNFQLQPYDVYWVSFDLSAL